RQRPRRGEMPDRADPAAVPVAVEERYRLGRRGPRDDQVEIAEIELARGVEIFVADVPAATDHQRAIDDPGLVVHAMIEPVAGQQDLDGIAQRAPAAVL